MGADAIFHSILLHALFGLFCERRNVSDWRWRREGSILLAAQTAKLGLKLYKARLRREATRPLFLRASLGGLSTIFGN